MDQPEIQFKKTRIAPTPSGYLHIGNALSFAITAGLAERFGAKILLRIDDLDRERANRKYIDDIFDTLNFLEIPWHEGPRDSDEFEKQWSQIHRMEMYGDALDRLKEQADVFACNCSRAQIKALSADDSYPGTCRDKHIPLDSPEVNWRIKTDSSSISINTLTGRVEATLPPSMKDFIIRKKDGCPAYQLSSVVDDEYFGIDLIVRGQDLWASTIAQHFLAEKFNALTFLNATFYHHPLLIETNGIKLSKSAGATSIKTLRESGKTPGDVYAAIAAMLGLEEHPTNRRDLVSLIGIG